MKEDLCYYEGCNRLAEVGGLCLKPYNLWLGNVDDKHKHGKSLEERFWSFVWKPTKDGCWLWRSSISHSGYGLFSRRLEGSRTSSVIGAHRFSWMLHYGDIPEHLQVLHSCDVRACVNPKHLYLGSQADNLVDMVEKSRSLYGERNSQVKLTENDVLEIRRLRRKTHLTQREIAEMFGVSQTRISYIALYKNWNYPKILEREKNE